MTEYLTIPRPAARVLLNSRIYSTPVQQDSGIGQIHRFLTGATQVKYQYKIPVGDSASVQEFLDVVAVVRNEDGLKQAEAAALDKFADDLTRLLKKVTILEEQTARAAAERQARMIAENRQYATERREKLMSSPIESARAQQLKQVAQDYGLDLKDPQIKAGLIAMFHAGARQMADVTMALMFGDPELADPAQLEKVAARDAQTFEQARAAANRTDDENR